MPSVIEYCLGSLDLGERECLEALERRVIERPCPQRCGSCFDGAVCVVDGVPTRGASIESILEELE